MGAATDEKIAWYLELDGLAVMTAVDDTAASLWFASQSFKGRKINAADPLDQ